MGNLIFNGISTTDLGVVIQSPPVYETPEKDYEVIHVEGRNGDILINKGSYRNSIRTYYLASVFRPNTSFAENARALADWLHSANGYARLEDSYDPDVYRMAMYRNSAELANYYDQATALEVEFECKPQKYLKCGEEEYILPTDGSSLILNNPTNFNALPIIYWNKPISGFELYIDNTLVLTLGNDSTEIASGVIDFDLKSAYTNSGYINNLLTLENDIFPFLAPGEHEMHILIDAIPEQLIIKMKPRWWTL